MNSSESIFDFLDEMKKSDIPEDIMFQKVNLFLQNKARNADTPFRGHFELTPLCNLSCKMCYVHLNNEQMGGQKLLSVKQWINLLQQTIDTGMVAATLSGGECLTFPGFDEVFLFLKSKGIITTVLTNAVLLDNERIRFFQKHRPRKIQISLYGSTDSAYEQVTGKRVFSIVKNNIIAAKEADLPIKISITPSKYMLPDFRNIISLVKDINIPYAINIGLMTPRPDTGRDSIEHNISIDEYIELIKFNRSQNNRDIKHSEVISRPDVSGFGYQLNGLRCGAGRSTFSINWRGIMYPCTQLTSITENCLENGFISSWKSINDKVKVYPRFIACDKCAYHHACSFCTAENEKLGSKYILDSTWCEKTWKMVENGLRPSQCD